MKPSIIYRERKILEYFTIDDVACNCGCGLVIVQKEFLERLNTLRYYFDNPIHVNSWTRCKRHNKAVRGKHNSFHLYGKAIDIRPARANSKMCRFQRMCEVHFPFAIHYAVFTHVDLRGKRHL